MVLMMSEQVGESRRVGGTGRGSNTVMPEVLMTAESGTVDKRDEDKRVVQFYCRPNNHEIIGGLESNIVPRADRRLFRMLGFSFVLLMAEQTRGERGKAGEETVIEFQGFLISRLEHLACV